MIQKSTPAPALAPAALPALLRELWRLLAAQRPAVRQARVFDRRRALVVGQLCAVARHTITYLLLTLGLVDTDPSAFYRLVGRARLGLDVDTLARCYLHETRADVPSGAATSRPCASPPRGLPPARPPAAPGLRWKRGCIRWTPSALRPWSPSWLLSPAPSKVLKSRAG